MTQLKGRTIWEESVRAAYEEVGGIRAQVCGLEGVMELLPSTQGNNRHTIGIVVRLVTSDPIPDKNTDGERIEVFDTALPSPMIPNERDFLLHNLGERFHE